MIRNRRREALAETYRRHGDAVYALVCAVLAERPMIEQVVTDVFTDLWDLADGYDPESAGLRYYLLGHAYQRAEACHDADPSRPRSQNYWAATPSGSDEPSLQGPLSTQVEAAVHQLSKDQREAIILAAFGANYHEVAAILGTTEAHIKTSLRTGLHRLRIVLSGHG